MKAGDILITIKPWASDKLQTRECADPAEAQERAREARKNPEIEWVALSGAFQVSKASPLKPGEAATIERRSA